MEKDTKHDFGDLLKAVKKVRIEKKSIRSVANSFKISKSSLGRYVNKLDAVSNDISTLDDDTLLQVLKGVQ